MGINKVANQDDVRYRSGIYGWNGLLIRSLPQYVSKSSTGGGSVDVTDYATNIKADTTAGDTAMLSGWFGYGVAPTPHKAIVEIGYYLNNTVNITDDIEIGWMRDAVNQQRGMYLDLTSGQYCVEDESVAAPTPTNTTSHTLLQIEADFEALQTTFTQKGNVDDTTTIDRVVVTSGGLGKGLISINSNGAGDDIRTTYARQEVVF